MPNIIEYSFAQLREFAEKCDKAYLKSLTVPLTYNDFRANAFNLMYKEPKANNIVPIQDGELVRIAPDTAEMLAIIEEHSKEIEDIKLNAPQEKKDFMLTQLFKELFKPKYEFTYKIPIVPVNVNGEDIMTPMWFSKTMKSINIRLGYDNGDSATPSTMILGDNVVHMMLGGRTGSGKSVALNTVECNLIVEYPPWELDIYLGDFKKVEGARYANRIPTPHMKIVAATGSTEFILSMYKTIIKEMNDRQSIFNACNVQKIEDFRKKFNLVMPRVILIVDEFTQMYENIKASETKGNENAAEDKKAVNSALSDIARLGRSMGIHMCLSSQQLDNLDQGVANQFGAGATLGAPPAVSTSLIGNDAGASIRGKGKGYYNMNKGAKSKADNVLVRIPYLESEQSEEDAAKGKLTNLLEILQQAYEQANAIGYHKELVFYDEDAPIPRQLYDEACIYTANKVLKRKNSPTLEDKIYTESLIAELPLGKEIKLSDEPVCCLTVQNQKNQAIIVNATDPEIRCYILRLLANDFIKLYPNAKHTVINADSSITYKAELDKLPNLDLKGRPTIPERLKGDIQIRKDLIELQAIFNDRGNGLWDEELAWEYIATRYGKEIKRISQPLTEIQKVVNKIDLALKNGENPNTTVEEMQTEKDSWAILHEVHYKYQQNFNLFRQRGEITFASLPLKVIWFIGLENFVGIDDSSIKKDFKWIFENATTVNILPIITGKIWTKSGGVVTDCNFAIERCDKTFFMDIGMPKLINANDRSIQLHNRNTKERNIVSLYSGI
jgi:hypothetical protein